MRDSLFLKDLVKAFRSGDLDILRTEFPLFNRDTWLEKNPGQLREYVDLRLQRAEIAAKLLDPLFCRPEIKIRDEDQEDRFKSSNLFCCVNYYLRKMRRIETAGRSNEIHDILRRFSLDYRKVTKEAHFPLAWIQLESNFPNGRALREIQTKIRDLELEKAKLESRLNSGTLEGAIESQTAANWDRKRKELFQRQSDAIDATIRESDNDFRLQESIKISEQFLTWAKFSRGKPGRHPKPFNVFVYHLIRLNTKRKFDKNRNYIYRKSGEFKLKTNWPLVLFLLLEIHVKTIQLPEIKRFIWQNNNESADQALLKLKKRLLGIYANFPPLQGWAFSRGREETGFRKIVNEEGQLRLIVL